MCCTLVFVSESTCFLYQPICHLLLLLIVSQQAAIQVLDVYCVCVLSIETFSLKHTVTPSPTVTQSPTMMGGVNAAAVAIPVVLVLLLLLLLLLAIGVLCLCRGME